MTTILANTEHFGEVAARTIKDMFGAEVTDVTQSNERASVLTSKTFIVSIYYTGTVYGEYMLAMDEETAAGICGIEEQIDDDNRDEIRESICDAMAETLNTIVGEAIVRLQESHAKLTVTAPRIVFGEVRYPSFRTGSTTLSTDSGEIECQ
ncbi:MAG: chemotaxis protein CheX, partial [Planctomycetaceae bacterium]